MISLCLASLRIASCCAAVFFAVAAAAWISLTSISDSSAPWPVRVVLEELSGSVPPLSVDSADEGERQKKKESEETYIQEVIDIFDGQISNIRPVRNKGGQANGDR